jgi:hypothetical protein
VDYHWPRKAGWWFWGKDMFLSKIKRELFRVRLQTEKLKMARVLLEFRPSNQWPVSIVNEGSRWVCKLECTDNPLGNVIAYGDCPEQACLNFDALWSGNIATISDPYEEDEEQF